MVNFKRGLGIVTLISSLVAVGVSLPAQADPGVFKQGLNSKLLGQALGADFQAGVPTGSQQVQSVANLRILGKNLQALQAVVNVPQSADGTSTAEFYSFG